MTSRSKKEPLSLQTLYLAWDDMYQCWEVVTNKKDIGGDRYYEIIVEKQKAHPPTPPTCLGTLKL